ncbi:glycoside hydrolase family 92 protein [Periconia macrospinosa]|uniref:Glycoside hydrolase family 92 protein n=1 Tax=Periconia macrospinosa TaxID=97972 RepID=A0A2V1DAK8_9PLEO|nr:glycoside hydrolase family 92 protein [Periconia macrospinosa]
MRLLGSKPNAVVCFGVLGAAGVLAQGNDKKSILDYVDPLIGTINGGHVFPGATLPYGMAKAVADVNGDNQGGFTSDNAPIKGFSHMHDSGTGGASSLGNFPIFPQICENNDVTKCKYAAWEREALRKQGSVKASPGYFAVGLDTNIHAEISVSNRTALYRFTFPASSANPAPSPNGTNPTFTNSTSPAPHILLELIDLPDSRQEAGIKIDNESGRMTGWGVFGPSFGIGNYTSYFCADFFGADLKASGIWDRGVPKNGSSLDLGLSGYGGAWVQFEKPEEKEQILVRVGLSFISSARACENAEREIDDPGLDTLEDLVDVARDAWEEKLGVVDVVPGGASEVILRAFWSGIYRTMISPQDYTGENPLWESDEPYYDSFYCIWDSFRSIHPLITLLDPHGQALFIRTLLDVYRHEGKLPDCRMSFCKGFTQGGSNADIVLVDSWLKGINAGIDWDLAYEAMLSDAEIEPPNWDVEGRGGLASWKKLGYIPKNDVDVIGEGTKTRSISRTVEYAYNDFVIALFALHQQHDEDAYKKYLHRSGNWKNLFKPNQTSILPNNGADTGFVGFLQPKLPDGTWDFQDPIFCSPLLDFTGCYLNPSGGETYEGPVWLYTFFVPGDMSTLIHTLGGADSFVKRLDFFHDSGMCYIGDEQAFLKVFLYHYAGRPGLSSKRAHYYIPSQFNDTVGGIPGNDDSGAMGSFAALTMMGIFPNAGQDVYFITPPFFESVSITNPQTGNTATIRNKNYDPGFKNIYIQSATLNGEPYARNWLTHKFFLEGGELELVLGPEESEWGTRPQDVPPSLGPFGKNGTIEDGGGGVEKRWYMAQTQPRSAVLEVGA